MKKILIVEDNDSVRNNLRDILELNKYKIVCAENGSEGFDMAVAEVPDLIISDVMMPEMDGYELLKKLREHSQLGYVPFIFLTAKSSYKDMRYGMNLSADDYLSKPFSVTELISAVETNLTKAKKYETKIEQLRDNIAFSIPHELRTPLTAILGFTEVLKDLIETDSSKDELEAVTDHIYDSGIRLNNVINKFILYSESSYVLQDTEMIKKFRCTELESVEAYVKPTAEKIASKLDRLNDLKLEINNSCFYGDSRHLIYFVEELVENACKFSKPHSEIIVSAKVEDGFWVLSVKDNGIGMSEAQKKTISALNQFNRKNNEVAGNGLGLPTLQNIIKIYKGKFTIESKPESFTKVIIEIPFGK